MASSFADATHAPVGEGNAHAAPDVASGENLEKLVLPSLLSAVPSSKHRALTVDSTATFTTASSSGSFDATVSDYSTSESGTQSYCSILESRQRYDSVFESGIESRPNGIDSDRDRFSGTDVTFGPDPHPAARSYDKYSTFRWMWVDAERNPFRWSRACSAETTAKRLLRYRHCAKQVKLESRGRTTSVMVFANVSAVLSYLDNVPHDSGNDVGLLALLGTSSLSGRVGGDNLLGYHGWTMRALSLPFSCAGAESNIENIRWMWGDVGGRSRCCFENPFRWSGAQTLQMTFDQLQRYRSQGCERPVKMEIVFRRRGPSDILVYPTVLAALNALHDLKQGIFTH